MQILHSLFYIKIRDKKRPASAASDHFPCSTALKTWEKRPAPVAGDPAVANHHGKGTIWRRCRPYQNRAKLGQKRAK
jgi:hypothetical protein